MNTFDFVLRWLRGCNRLVGLAFGPQPRGCRDISVEIRKLAVYPLGLDPVRGDCTTDTIAVENLINHLRVASSPDDRLRCETATESAH
jgi:hypothetical protein